MSTLYNEYLTGAEREMAIIVAESDAQYAKLNVLFEAVDATLEANMLAAEAKVFAESGTYDDLTMLYKEAGEEANEKKMGVFATILNSIASFFAKIGNWITSKFGKNVDKKIAEIPDEEVNLDKSFLEKINIFKKGWDILKGSVEKIKSGDLEGIGDITKAWAPIVTAFGAVASGATVVAVKRNTIIEWIKWLKDTVLAKANAAINACKIALGIGSVGAAVTKGKSDEDNKETDGEPKKKGFIDTAIEYGKKALDALKKFAGWISGFLGKLYSALPFKKKDIDEEVKNKDSVNDINEAKPAGPERPYQPPVQATESVSICGVDLESDLFCEYEMSDAEYSELCEVFAEL